jgi:hypothetical protein
MIMLLMMIVAEVDSGTSSLPPLLTYAPKSNGDGVDEEVKGKKENESTI